MKSYKAEGGGRLYPYPLPHQVLHLIHLPLRGLWLGILLFTTSVFTHLPLPSFGGSLIVLCMNDNITQNTSPVPFNFLRFRQKMCQQSASTIYITGIDTTRVA